MKPCTLLNKCFGDACCLHLPHSVTPWRSVNSYKLFGRIWWIFSDWAALNPENETSLLSQYAGREAYRSDFYLNEYSEIWVSQRSSPCRGLCHVVLPSFRDFPFTLKLFQILRIHFTMIIRPAYVWTAWVYAETLEWHIESENDNCRPKQWNSFKMRSI